MRMNLHTHTLFCDGADSPETLARTALEKGFNTLGFSGHSYTFFDEGWCMSRRGTADYRARVLALKAEYAGRLNILLGVEQDIYSRESTEGYDFVIGSVHYLLKNGVYWPVDESPERLREAIVSGWGGDAYAFAADYFALEARWAERPDCAVVGHFDLLTKFNKNGDFFDQRDRRYIKPAMAALERLAASGKTFEINTGGMARGYLDRPYPDFPLLERLLELGAPMALSSDCHSADKLDYAFGDPRLEKFIK